MQRFLRFLLPLAIYSASLAAQPVVPIDGASPAKHPDARDYYAELTGQDKGNISYVISTLGNNSVFSLMFKQGELEQRGNATGHIHPLRYFNYVLSDDDLRGSFQRMSGRPWREFKEGFSRSFNKAHERNNLSDGIIADFAKDLSLDKERVTQLLRQQNWHRFLDYLHSR